MERGRVEEVLRAYKRVYRDNLAFDLAGLSKEERIEVLEDERYQRESARIKAEMFAQEVSVLDGVIAGENSEDGMESSGVILKALEMKQRLLMGGMEEEASEEKALNVKFVGTEREEYEMDENVEIERGDGEIGVEFGEIEGEGFEEQMRRDVKERMRDGGVTETSE